MLWLLPIGTIIRLVLVAVVVLGIVVALGSVDPIAWLEQALVDQISPFMFSRGV